MAVNFTHGIETLLSQLKKCGYRPEVVDTTARSDRILAAVVKISSDTVLHWDRDSYTVWAEGPREKARRVERRLRKAVRGGALSRLWRQPRLLAALIMTLAILATSYSIGRNRPPIVPSTVPPPAAQTATPPASAEKVDASIAK
jgi:hypothetical protein